MMYINCNGIKTKQNDSRRRDGEVVIHKDISGVFGEVPEDILERVKYVESVENRRKKKWTRLVHLVYFSYR